MDRERGTEEKRKGLKKESESESEANEIIVTAQPKQA